MKRSRRHCRSLAKLTVLVFALTHIQAAYAQPSPDEDTVAAWAAMAPAELAGTSGGTRGFDLGIVIDDIQVNAPQTSTTVAGNTITGFDTGEAVGNLMSDIHGFGNTMVVNTGVLTMSNSVNVNVTVDMAR